MKSALVAVLAVGCSGAQVTPVQKVIQLMEGMVEKGKAEKQAEEVQFAEYKSFCDNTAANKKKAIAEANEKIEMLKADIQEAAADAARLSVEIKEHDDDIAIWTGDEDAATKVRNIEKADYDALHQDYSESIDALNRAIAVLKKQSHDRKQASFAQISSLQKLNLIPDAAKKTLDAFLQMDGPDDEGLEVQAPESNAYQFQSGKVIAMLEKLLDKFVQERTVLEKEEMDSKHAYEMLMSDLKTQISEATEDRTEKAETKAKRLQQKADGEGDLTDTTTTRDDDAAYLSDLVGTCEQKGTDFMSRQELRAEELEAINKAIEIVSSGAVSGAADEHLPGLIQSTSLAQLRATSMTPAQARVHQFLQDRSEKFGSRVLAALATHVQNDPLGKVKKMIKDLIIKLMEEANEEAEHKGWCDMELGTNAQTRKEKTQAVELLHAEIDELEASITKLTEDITELTKAVAELDEAMAKATNLRNKEKTKNTATIADAEGAQVAVAQALTVLKEFYAKAAEATALVQIKQQPEAPEVFDEPYKGMGAESGGVVGMLEVIEQDFARLAADTDSAEQAAQQEYDQFMQDSKVDKTQKTSSIEHKSAKKQDETQTLTQKKADLEGTQKELDAALAYYDKLKPDCVGSGEAYEDRVKRREEEIESLKEALSILNGEDMA
jgi:prefoldin subunit 5